MIELRFHREIYAGEAIDEALKVFDRFATWEREQAEDAWVVRCTHDDTAREHKVAHELANYALGLTIRRGGAT